FHCDPQFGPLTQRLARVIPNQFRSRPQIPVTLHHAVREGCHPAATSYRKASSPDRPPSLALRAMAGFVSPGARRAEAEAERNPGLSVPAATPLPGWASLDPGYRSAAV